MLVENYRWKHDPTCRGLLAGGRVSPERSGTAGGASGAVAGRRMWWKVVGSGATKIHKRGGAPERPVASGKESRLWERESILLCITIYQSINTHQI